MESLWPTAHTKTFSMYWPSNNLWRNPGAPWQRTSWRSFMTNMWSSPTQMTLQLGYDDTLSPDHYVYKIIQRASSKVSPSFIDTACTMGNRVSCLQLQAMINSYIKIIISIPVGTICQGAVWPRPCWAAPQGGWRWSESFQPLEQISNLGSKGQDTWRNPVALLCSASCLQQWHEIVANLSYFQLMSSATSSSTTEVWWAFHGLSLLGQAVHKEPASHHLPNAAGTEELASIDLGKDGYRLHWLAIICEESHLSIFKWCKSRCQINCIRDLWFWCISWVACHFKAIRDATASHKDFRL